MSDRERLEILEQEVAELRAAVTALLNLEAERGTPLDRLPLLRSRGLKRPPRSVYKDRGVDGA